MNSHARTCTLAAAGLAAACGLGDGNLSVRLDGEEGARTGLPTVHTHGDSGTHAHAEFSDGWQINFERYLVSMRSLEIRDGSGELGFNSEGSYIYDLSRDIPEIELLSLASQRWDRFGFEIASPYEDDTQWLGEGVTQDDAQLMIQAGATHLIEGHAHHPETGRDRTFRFVIDAPVRAVDCTNGADESLGVIVEPKTTEVAALTFHVDYLFTGELDEKGATLRFEAMAAVADDDGHIDFDALIDQPLADLHDAEGAPLVDPDGSPVFYDPGGTSLPANDLASFVREAVRAQPHLNGEGRCTLERTSL